MREGRGCLLDDSVCLNCTGHRCTLEVEYRMGQGCAGDDA